jgi:hypothetical protein
LEDQFELPKHLIIRNRGSILEVTLYVLYDLENCRDNLQGNECISTFIVTKVVAEFQVVKGANYRSQEIESELAHALFTLDGRLPKK